ncbi:MAG: inosine-uridine nucleoside N-ribohydrolase [Candidatus Promineifilaceae bacterium]|jgi:inosine-uridine nucleoside N-ribohydrolase
MTKKVILDVDTGTDDAIALMIAALSPDLELIGATTVIGNVPCVVCTENTMRVFAHIGIHAPVHQGMVEPMVRPDFDRPEVNVIHGRFLPLPETDRKPTSLKGVDWLIETFMASDGDITLVPVGPLTNVAMAIRKCPEIVNKIPEMVIMGGAHHHGNSTASAEFNIWVDPEAAKVVVNSGIPIRMVPLDATHQALTSLDDCAKFRATGTPAAIAAASFTEQRIKGYSATQPMKVKDTTPIHDALAVCAVIDPSVLITDFIHVDVETKGELTDGRTVCDFSARSGKAPNVHFATGVNAPKFRAMMFDILSRTM